ncbi:PqqD family protein [candidate division KSB1 bacterium]|nr:PqqD family protein [candidate division KSB1 bacterium]NIR71166.1 PqqD family protein [candidate division KSB1 bacterium]NIS23296.1 PqqD family protein [candidate division KSB1 bacterium]NIT70175.1 PqqD family protein [candidate division KSB1 bacterium]NIU23826.1 PqqD family protein [candidate division KSB1 bacterium]
MKRPNYRLKLDDIGTFVWERCNGMKKVEEIGEQLKKEFGEEVEPVHERLALFFRQLQKSNSITWT